MAMDIAAALSVFRFLLQAGASAKDAWKDEGFGKDEISALGSLVGAGEGIWKLRAKKDEDMELGALQLALVTRCFGYALGRYMDYSDQLAAKAKPLFQNELASEQQGQPSPKRIEQLLESVSKIRIDPGNFPPGLMEFEVVESLTGSPLATPYYNFLWTTFFKPRTGESSLVSLQEDGGIEFERYFLLAWDKAMASASGARLRHYLEGLGQGYKQRLLQELLVSDMAGWGNRHTFGNIKPEEAREGDPLPFMPLEGMYVEPSASIVSKNDEELPVLALLAHTLKSHNVVILQADFGMGKSLTARMLTTRLARQFRNEAVSSLDRVLPVHARCVDDLKPPELSPRSIVLRARRRQAEALGYSLKLDDPALASPPAQQRTLFLIDGLDEVHLSESGLETFFESIKDEATEKHQFIIFSRPGAIPSGKNLRTLKDLPVLELHPWDEKQVDDWLNRWNHVKGGSGPTQREVVAQNLGELAKTPILLLMIAHTWNAAESGRTINRAELYERFFQSIACGKHEADKDEHPAIFQASRALKERLISKSILTRDVTEPDAMLWLMSRVASEASPHLTG